MKHLILILLTYTSLLFGTKGWVGSTGDMFVSGQINVDSNTLTVEPIANEVGIGTDNPSELLHLVGGDLLLENGESIKFKDAGGSIRKVLAVESTDNVVMGGVNFDDFIIKVGTISDAVIIKEVTGNMGIGIDLPGFKLDVSQESGTFGGAIGLSVDTSAVGFYYATAVASQDCDTTCPNEDANAGFNSSSGICQAAWTNAAAISTCATAAADQKCLCLGAK